VSGGGRKEPARFNCDRAAGGASGLIDASSWKVNKMPKPELKKPPGYRVSYVCTAFPRIFLLDYERAISPITGFFGA